MLPSIPIARVVPHITPAVLSKHLAAARPTPLHLTGLVNHWLALRWSASTTGPGDGLSQLRQATGEHTEVEVEVGKRGRGYLDPDFQRVSMGFGLFLDAFILKTIPSSSSPDQLPTAYLAQGEVNSQLEEAMPALPLFRSGPQGAMYRRALWVGPGGSFTPFHRDPYIGLYTHVLGSKTFWLLPPGAKDLLDPSPQPLHQNTSQIPLSVPAIFSREAEQELPPRIVNRARDQLTAAFKLDGACRVEIAPGESVLLPEGWWHSALGSEGPGIGVNAWFR